MPYVSEEASGVGPPLHLYGILEGSANLKSKPDQESCGKDPVFTVGIPKGCVVRNTFLEWQEEDAEGDGLSPCFEGSGGGSPLGAPCTPTRRRARSAAAALVRPVPEEDSLSTCNTHPAWQQQQDVAGGYATPSQMVGEYHQWQHVQQEESPYPGEDGAAAGRPEAGRHPYRAPAGGGGRRERGGGMFQQQQTASQGDSQPGDTTGGRGEGKVARSSREKRMSSGASLMLRGLPFSATEEDVVEFIEQMGASDTLAPGHSVSLLINSQGRPSGFAEVQLAKASMFWEVQEKLHMQRLGGRYIEALAPQKTPGKWSGSAGGNFGSQAPQAAFSSAPRQHNYFSSARRDMWRRTN
jgi:hypothetical protein